MSYLIDQNVQEKWHNWTKMSPNFMDSVKLNRFILLQATLLNFNDILREHIEHNVRNQTKTFRMPRSKTKMKTKTLNIPSRKDMNTHLNPWRELCPGLGWLFEGLVYLFWQFNILKKCTCKAYH